MSDHIIQRTPEGEVDCEVAHEVNHGHAEPASTLSVHLGRLAEEGEDPRDGQRDIVASAIHRALMACDWAELPNLSKLLARHLRELQNRADRSARKNLSVRGNIQAMPFLALCAQIHRSGFVRSDGMQARAMLFLALVDLAIACPEHVESTPFKNAATGLRVMLERMDRSPKSGYETKHFSVWQLFEWVDKHSEHAEYVKNAVQKLRAPFLAAWHALGTADSSDMVSLGDEDESVEGQDTPNGMVWTIPASSLFESELPPEMKRTLLANAMTRITALSRYADGSLLLRSDEIMTDIVSNLVLRSRGTSADGVHAVASLLAIAGCMPVPCAYDVLWSTGGTFPGVPTYPGVLTHDARWLIRSEFDPRRVDSDFSARTLHIPIPEPLAAILREMYYADREGEEVIHLPINHTALSPRESSAWETTLASRLMHDTQFGISLAQHVMHSSFGIDTSPLYYDRIPAIHIAHRIAQVTHQWFGCKPRPHACGLPTHEVGSQRVVPKKQIRLFMETLRIGWSANSELWKRIHMRSRNLRYGILLSVGHRINDDISDISTQRIARGDALITVADKAVAIDCPHRLAALGTKVIGELEEYLAELQEAVSIYPGTALAIAAARILAGEQCLFLSVNSKDHCHPTELGEHKAEAPVWAYGIDNWLRQYINHALSEKLLEPHRVAQLGWTGTRAGAISEISTQSPVDVLTCVRSALDNVLKQSGWASLPRSGYAHVSDTSHVVHWSKAYEDRKRAFQKGLAKLKSSAKEQRLAIAEKTLPAVNAFFRENAIPLMAGVYEITRTKSCGPVSIDRGHHAALLRAMGGTNGKTVVANEQLFSWLSRARRKGEITGPLPRQVIRTRPRNPAPFVAEAHHSLHHRQVLLDAIHASKLSVSARTFLTVLLEGWVPDVDNILQLMQPGATLHDLDENDVLLIESSAASPVRGCFAFNSAAGAALRAWHRSGSAVIVDNSELSKEIYSALDTFLSAEVLPTEVLGEIEALMRTTLGLKSPGIVRAVVMRDIVPAFAPIERVVALHEKGLVWPLEDERRKGTRIKEGVIKARKLKALDEYEKVKVIVSSLVEHWTVAKDAHQRQEAVSALHMLVPNDGPQTGSHLIALYAAGYLRAGIRKDLVRPVTVQDAVYSVGTALTKALPEQADYSRREMWEATYARALEGCAIEKRANLAKDLTHFQAVMFREYDVPLVNFAPLLDALDIPAPPQLVGFLTRAEQEATVSIAKYRAGEAENERSPLEQREALSSLAIIATAHATNLRDREFRIPVCTDWHLDSEGSATIGLRSNSQDFIKTSAGRRAARLTGDFALIAKESLTRLSFSIDKPTSQLAKEKLFGSADFARGRTDLSDVQAIVNEDLRYITSLPSAAIDLTRKTWAISAFRALDPKQPSLWYTRDLLAQMGQASIGVLQGHYLHDPLVFLERIQRSKNMTQTSAGWLFGMNPRAAFQLLSKESSWLRPKRAQEGQNSATVCELRVSFEPRHFEPTLCAMEELLNILAQGRSPRASLAIVAWPLQLENALSSAIKELEQSGLIIGQTDNDGFKSIDQPQRAHMHPALDACRSDAYSWNGLAWVFQQIMEDWRAWDSNGFAARPIDWAQRIRPDMPLAMLSWHEERMGHMTMYRLNADRKYGHSPWVAIRWLALAAWLRKRIFDCPLT